MKTERVLIVFALVAIVAGIIWIAEVAIRLTAHWICTGVF